MWVEMFFFLNTQCPNVALSGLCWNGHMTGVEKQARVGRRLDAQLQAGLGERQQAQGGKSVPEARTRTR